MQSDVKQVWYACYGSNLRKERFMCYIAGGTPAGALVNFRGCADRTPPVESGPVKIPYELYFAKRSPTWNGGGICFLRPGKDEEAETLGRRYLINTGQFIDLVRQELKIEDKIVVDFEQLKERGYYNCFSKGRYGMLLYLGEVKGLPVITFTSETYLENEINKPDETYLSTIIKGLKETYDLNTMELKEYLQDKTGVLAEISEDELIELIVSKS
ncbi:hypothetical protein MKO06_04470 [Gramella sp. GC03-9]|uniref:Histone deacetylase n=1 Tax=Christiangramia oceanisediminis TaxID=2920386 RepID=A0A9X2I3H4_9FLAO|nr:hypothetical protein [Gramella oceanisediminis]MCP9199150.1 hypothetical protein [Gramella oceanisediminis]